MTTTEKHDIARKAAPQPARWLWRDRDWDRLNSRVAFALIQTLDSQRALLPAQLIMAHVWQRGVNSIIKELRNEDKRRWLSLNVDYMTAAAARALVREGCAVLVSLAYRKKPDPRDRSVKPDGTVIQGYYHGVTTALAAPGHENNVLVPADWDVYERVETPAEWGGHPLMEVYATSPIEYGRDPADFTLATPFGLLHPFDGDVCGSEPILPPPPEKRIVRLVPPGDGAP